MIDKISINSCCEIVLPKPIRVPSGFLVGIVSEGNQTVLSRRRGRFFQEFHMFDPREFYLINLTVKHEEAMISFVVIFCHLSFIRTDLNEHRLNVHPFPKI